MALTILFMMFFSLILVIRNFKNKYSLLFILMVLGMSISMFTIISEIYKSSNYLIPSFYIYSGIEYRMFLFLNTILRFPLSSLLILRNLGIVIYFLAIMIFIISFDKTKKSSILTVKRTKNAVKYIFLILYPVIYFCFYHPHTAYRIYLINQSLKNSGFQPLWLSFITIIDLIMCLATLFYLINPIAFLIRNYKNNKITFFAEQTISLALSLGLLNFIFFMLFFTGAFKTSVDDVFRSAFWRYKYVFIVPTYYVTILPILSLSTLLVILYIIIKFNTGNLINGLKERAIKKNLNLLNSNLKDILHSNKNIMFNTKILTEEAIEAYGTEKGLELLNKILTLSDSHMNAISKALENIRELKVRTLYNSFNDAIDAALKEVTIPNGITLTKNFPNNPVYCNMDMYHMTQVISNLLNNAIDAINSRVSDEPRIDLFIDTSRDFIYFSVKDNGCGIPKKTLKKIFSPYFSTKSKQNNWGIGLSYVFRVITSHYGQIRIRSKQEEFTIVEILLPRQKNK